MCEEGMGEPGVGYLMCVCVCVWHPMLVFTEHEDEVILMLYINS